MFPSPGRKKIHCAILHFYTPKRISSILAFSWKWSLTSLYIPCGSICAIWEIMWALSSSNSGVRTSAIDAKVFSPIGLHLTNEETVDVIHPDQWEASNLVGTQSVTNLFTFHKKLTTTTFIIHRSPTFLDNRGINWISVFVQQAEASIWVAQMKMFGEVVWVEYWGLWGVIY